MILSQVFCLFTYDKKKGGHSQSTSRSGQQKRQQNMSQLQLLLLKGKFKVNYLTDSIKGNNCYPLSQQKTAKNQKLKNQNLAISNSDLTRFDINSYIFLKCDLYHAGIVAKTCYNILTKKEMSIPTKNICNHVDF